MRVLLTQLTNAGLIILKEKEHPQEIQSYIPAKRAMEISLMDILEATGGHLNCNRPLPSNSMHNTEEPHKNSE